MLNEFYLKIENIEANALFSVKFYFYRIMSIDS